MALKDIQSEVDAWVSQLKIGYFPPSDIMLRLSEEVGELAREISHRFGVKKKKPAEETQEIADEIADIFFTLTCLANSQGIDLDAAFARVMDKCYGRDKDRYEKK